MIDSPRLLVISLCALLALSAGCSALTEPAKNSGEPVTPEAVPMRAAPAAQPRQAAPRPPAESGAGQREAAYDGGVYRRYGLEAKFDPAAWSAAERAAADFLYSAEIYFYFDSAALTDDAKEVLRQKADRLKDSPRLGLLVAGHSDERGGDEYNLHLGERRARAARAYLISLGVAAARLETVSFGKRFPVDRGSGESAWSRNRRDEFLVFRP